MRFSKSACAVLAAVMMSALPAFAASPLTAEQISEAKIEGNHLVKNKKVNFAFFSSDSVDVDGHFLAGDERTEVIGYWLTPYAHVVSEQMAQGRDSRHLSFAAIDEAGETYQLRLLFTVRNFQRDAFLASEIRVMQVGKTLTPSSVRYAPLQKAQDYDIIPSKTLSKVGVVLEFPASEINSGESIHVMMTGDGGTPIVLEFPNNGSYDDYETKSHKFKWSPLNDTI